LPTRFTSIRSDALSSPASLKRPVPCMISRRRHTAKSTRSSGCR
jgi:hypothetical protein